MIWRFTKLMVTTLLATAFRCLADVQSLRLTGILSANRPKISRTYRRLKRQIILPVIKLLRWTRKSFLFAQRWQHSQLGWVQLVYLVWDSQRVREFEIIKTFHSNSNSDSLLINLSLLKDLSLSFLQQIGLNLIQSVSQACQTALTDLNSESQTLKFSDWTNVRSKRSH